MQWSNADTCREAEPKKRAAALHLLITYRMGGCPLPTAGLILAPTGPNLELFQPHCRPELEVVALSCTAHLFPPGWLLLRTHGLPGRRAWSGL